MNYHDMSAGIVKLDLDTLINNAAAAVAYTRQALDKELSSIDSQLHDRLSKDRDTAYRANSHCSMDAARLATIAKDYAVAWETYHALLEARSRETIEIIRE